MLLYNLDMKTFFIYPFHLLRMIRIIINFCPCVSRNVEDIGFGVLDFVPNSKRWFNEICQGSNSMTIFGILMIVKNSTVITLKIYNKSKKVKIKLLPLTTVGETFPETQHNSLFGESECCTCSKFEIITQIANSLQFTARNFGNLKN